MPEREGLAARRDELAPALMTTPESLHEFVELAIMEMFGSYRSMRQTDAEAAHLARSTRRVLDAFPGWAVVKVCKSIQSNGVWRDGKFDRVWPPNDSEIAHAVREEIKFYQNRHDLVAAMLDAAVEER